MGCILVVDNDEYTVELIRDLLTIKCRLKIDCAFDGFEALKKLKENTAYNLVILDLMMPRMSGIDVCKKMSKDRVLSEIPVLIVSALPVDSPVFLEAQGKFNELKVVQGVLEKPFELDDLCKKVEEIMKK